MFASRSLLLLATIHFTTILAVPNVTVVPLNTGAKADCSSWPWWIPTRDADTTGTLQFEVAYADDSAVNGLISTWRSMNYNGGRADDVLIDLRKTRSIAKPAYRCSNGTLRDSATLKRTIKVRRQWNNAQMSLDEATDGYDLEPYAHYVDGVRVDGVYLGAKGKTTWGFAYVRPQECGELDYYQTTLLGLPEVANVTHTAGYRVQFQGFLKVVTW